MHALPQVLSIFPNLMFYSELRHVNAEFKLETTIYVFEGAIKLVAGLILLFKGAAVVKFLKL